jgi:hypothetical protein
MSESKEDVKDYKKAACIVSYQELLAMSCAGKCGQPLVAGAGPGYEQRKMVFDAETGRWFHIRCYDTCVPEDWVAHVTEFTKDSQWDSDSQAQSCIAAIQQWMFLRTLKPHEDLFIRGTHWTHATLPSHLDTFFVDIGENYARRSVWPDVEYARKAPLAIHTDMMFPNEYWTQMRLVYCTHGWNAQQPNVEFGLVKLRESLTEALDKMQLYAEPFFFEQGDTLYLSLEISAVQGSKAAHEPMKILSRGSMKSTLPVLRKRQEEILAAVQTVVSATLETTLKTLPETGVKKTWEVDAVQTRIEISENGRSIAVGMSRNRAPTNVLYFRMSRVVWVRLDCIKYDPDKPIYAPFAATTQNTKLNARNLLNAKEVKVTALSIRQPRQIAEAKA